MPISPRGVGTLLQQMTYFGVPPDVVQGSVGSGDFSPGLMREVLGHEGSFEQASEEICTIVYHRVSPLFVSIL